MKVRNGLLYVIMMILCVGCGPQQQAGENTGREAIVSATAVEKPAIRQMKTIQDNGEYMVSEYDPDGKLLSETDYDTASNETGRTDYIYNENGDLIWVHDVCTDMTRNAGMFDITEEYEYVYYE